MVAAYLLVSCVVHYILLPESYPGPGDFPRHGQTFINPESGESVTFIKDRYQGDPDEVVIQVEFAVEGSVPLAHVHSNMNEVFSGLEETTHLLVDGVEHTLTRGQSIEIKAGTPHLPYNKTANASKVKVQMNPVGVFDLCLVNIHQTLSKPASHGNWLDTQLQLARYASLCDVYRGDIPVWIQKVGLFFIAPTIRALGYPAWKVTKL